MRFPGFSVLQHRTGSFHERTQASLQEYRGSPKKNSFNIKIVSDLLNGSGQNGRSPPTSKSPLYSAKVWSECERSSAVLKWSHLLMASVLLFFLFILRLKISYAIGGSLLRQGIGSEVYEISASDVDIGNSVRQHPIEDVVNNPHNNVEPPGGRILLADVYPSNSFFHSTDCLNELISMLSNVKYGATKVDLELLTPFSDDTSSISNGVNRISWPHGNKVMTPLNLNSSSIVSLTDADWLGRDINIALDHISRKDWSGSVILFVVNPDNCLKLSTGSVHIPSSFWESLNRSQRVSSGTFSAFKSSLKPVSKPSPESNDDVLYIRIN